MTLADDSVRILAPRASAAFALDREKWRAKKRVGDRMSEKDFTNSSSEPNEIYAGGTVPNSTRSDLVMAAQARARRVDTPLWENDRGERLPSRGTTKIPIGVIGRACPRCGSHHLVGVKITPTADEMDPNIGCTCCNYFWD